MVPKLKLIFDVGVSKKAEIFFKGEGFDILSIRELNGNFSVYQNEKLKIRK